MDRGGRLSRFNSRFGDMTFGKKCEGLTAVTPEAAQQLSGISMEENAAPVYAGAFCVRAYVLVATR